MKQVLLLSVSLSLTFHCSGQTVFERGYGGAQRDEAKAIKQTADGGYIIVGYTESFGVGSQKVYLIKTDANGNIQWDRTYLNNVADFGYSVSQTNDGGFIITGLSFTGSDNDVFVIKTDPSGNLQWSKTYGQTALFGDAGRSIQQTVDGGYIIGGDRGTAIDSDIYLIRIDSVGDTLWTRIYGGSNLESCEEVQQTYDGGFIAVGFTRSYGAGNRDVYLIKTDPNGDTLWTRTFGTAGDEQGYSVKQTADSGYVIAGSIGVWSVLLIKTDLNGNQSWAKIYSGSDDEIGYSVEQTSDGGYIISGFTRSWGPGAGTEANTYLIKTDDVGDTLWTRVIGGGTKDMGVYAIQTNDEGYAIVGYTSSFSFGDRDLFFMKTDSLGNIPCNIYPTSTNVSNIFLNQGTGGVISSGAIVGIPATVVSDPATLDSIVCYSCNISISISVINTAEDSCNGQVSISVNGGTPPYSFQWNDPNNQTTQTATGLCSSTYCVTVTDSMGCSTTSCDTIGITIGIDQMDNGGLFLIHPNPFTESTTLTIMNDELLMFNKKVEFALFDQLGRQVRLFNIQHSTFNIPRSGLPAGIYFYRLQSEHGLLGTGKLIVVH